MHTFPRIGITCITQFPCRQTNKPTNKHADATRRRSDTCESSAPCWGALLLSWKNMRMPGVEPGSQAWEACMMPLHYMRFCTQRLATTSWTLAHYLQSVACTSFSPTRHLRVWLWMGACLRCMSSAFGQQQQTCAFSPPG